LPGMKTALVTGGKARIGRDISLGLARSGWNVALHFHTDGAQAEAVVAELEAHGVKAMAVQADLANPDALAQLFPVIAARLGPVTGLINNASRFLWDDAATVTPALFTEHMQVNLLAPLLLSQAFARQLPAGAIGSIINIIDQRVWKLTPAYLSYTLSKSALWTLTQTLAQSLAPHVRVNAVGPGPTLANVHQQAGLFEAEARSIPLGPVVDPAAVTEAVLYLMQAKAVTGQMIAVDGGQHLGWQTPDALLEMTR
jgi:NAD(P)-dependent dehydrogenase (short-subunit alcohol dehydrogenase family)